MGRISHIFNIQEIQIACCFNLLVIIDGQSTTIFDYLAFSFNCSEMHWNDK